MGQSPLDCPRISLTSLRNKNLCIIRASLYLVFLIFSGTLTEGQVRLVDVTGRAGIDWSHQNGATPEKYLIETMGGGGAFLDYDSDGWLDVYLVDSGSHLHSRTHIAARNMLYIERIGSQGILDPIHFSGGLDELVPHPQIHSEVGRRFEVILDVEPNCPLSGTSQAAGTESASSGYAFPPG